MQTQTGAGQETAALPSEMRRLAFIEFTPELLRHYTEANEYFEPTEF